MANMVGIDGIVKLPWLNKTNFLQTKFNLPELAARAIIDLHKQNYKFTAQFLKAVTEQSALQELLVDGRFVNAATTTGFTPLVLENLSRKLPFSIIVEDKVFALKEKAAQPASSPGIPHIRPPLTATAVEPAKLSPGERIEAAKEMERNQLKALEPQSLVGELRVAWAQKDPAAFLVAYIKLARLSFIKFSTDIDDVMVTMDEKEIPFIADAMQGKNTPGFSLIFSSGTAGERWHFKSPFDKDKPNIHYSPNGPYDFSDVFSRSLQGCPGFEVRGKHLFLYLE